MIFKIKMFGFCIFAIILTGCGSGGGGTTTNNTVDPSTSYKVFAPHSWLPGTQYTFLYSGSDTQGFTYTGQISWAKRNDTTYNGTPATQVDAFVQLTDNTGASITGNTSSYSDATTGFAIGFVNNTSGLVCDVVNPTQDLPSTVKHGDFGNSLAYSCSDGSNVTGSWQANLDQASGNMKLTLSTTSRDQYGTIAYTEDDTVYIDTQGVPHRIDIRLTQFSAGVSQDTITLSSN